MLFTFNKNDKIIYFASLLDKEQQKVYKNITEERLNIFLQGFVLGLIMPLVYLRTLSDKKQPVYCIFVAIVLGVTYIHYSIMPNQLTCLNISTILNKQLVRNL